MGKREKQDWAEGDGAVPTKAYAGPCCSGDDLHSQVEVKELDLYILSAGCRRPSGKGRDLGPDSSLQPRAIPGQG